MRINTVVLPIAVALAITAALFAPQVGARQTPQSGQKSQALESGVVCRNHLKQMGVAMMMYAQDNDETFPPMRSAAQVQNRLRPYVRDASSFYCPVTRQPYKPSQALSGKSLSSIEVLSTVTMLSDARAHPDGTENIAYADAHVKRRNHSR